MTSGTLAGWQPLAPSAYYQPVQDEDATAGLCGAEMPDGRGILVWPNGGDARFAVVASPAAWLADDIVPTGDMDTITTGDVARTSVCNIDGELYVVVDRWQGSGGQWTLDIYQADDPTDPYAGWTLASNVATTNIAGSVFGYTSWGAGIPLKLDSGRWVIAQGGGESAAQPGWAASGTFVHAWYSDGGAAGPWVQTLEYGHHLSGFPRTGWVSAQVVADPANGDDLYITSGAISTNESLLWRSQNDAASWSGFNSLWSVVGPGLSPCIDNATDAFALWTTDTYRVTGDPTDMSAGWSADAAWRAPGMSGDDNTRKAIIAALRVFYFVVDQVADGGGLRVPGWIIGEVQSGTEVLSGWE